jgi:uncharacterized protein
MSLRPSRPWTPCETGVQLFVRLTPRAGRDAVDGTGTDEDGRPVLRVRVRAPPVEGAANAALSRFLAKALALRSGAVRIEAGERSRTKRLVIDGDPVALAEKLERLVAPRNN